MVKHDSRVIERNGRRVALRTTDCCGAHSTYCEDVLCCKACYHEVDFGQGDGLELIDVQTLEVIDAHTLAELDLARCEGGSDA